MRGSISMYVGLAQTCICQGKLRVSLQTALERGNGILQVLGAIVVLQVASSAQITVIGPRLGGAVRFYAPAVFFGQLNVEIAEHLFNDPVLNGKNVGGIRRNQA